MTFTTDRKLMAPVDVDTLFKLVWAMLDADADFFKPHGPGSYWKARENLIDFILAHRLEFLDLIFRGRCSDWRHDYVCHQNRPNGSFDPTISYPAFWVESENRYEHPREVFHYHFTDAKLAEWWQLLGDVPIDENENLDVDFVVEGAVLFPKGTPREDTWHWFDQRHSLGVYKLMGLEKNDEGPSQS